MIGQDEARTSETDCEETVSDGDDRVATSAEAEQVSLVVVCGPPGVGKTTVAGEAAAQVGGTVLRTDVVRKDLFPDPAYDESETEAVYEELLARSRERLADGESVVLDGTFRTVAQRERAAELATECDCTFELLRVACEESIVRRRIENREDDASDADFDVHRMIREEFEPIDRDHERIDNSGSSAETCESVAEWF